MGSPIDSFSHATVRLTVDFNIVGQILNEVGISDDEVDLMDMKTSGTLCTCLKWTGGDFKDQTYSSNHASGW